MPLTVTVIISGRPVDNEENRAWATWLGIGHIPFPQAEINSIMRCCHNCGALVWVAPDQQMTIRGAAIVGAAVPILCLICVKLAQPGLLVHLG